MTRCRVCGCIEEAACIRETAVGIEVCHWSEPDLCSACAEESELGFRGWEHPPRAYTNHFATRIGTTADRFEYPFETEMIS